MIHRHLTYRKDVRVDALPSAALVDILDRGDLDTWRPIAAAIRLDPHGAVADRVLDLLSANPMYGTSPLWRAWIERCRIRAEARPVPEREVLDLATLRRRSGLTQAALAARAGMTQSDLSKLERRADVRLSSLRAFARALGGRIEAVYTNQQTRIRLRIGPDTPRGQERGTRKVRRARGSD